jgi:hypothetical protein
VPCVLAGKRSGRGIQCRALGKSAPVPRYGRDCTRKIGAGVATRLSENGVRIP